MSLTGAAMMFKHILLPTDGSPLSDKGVRLGISFAKRIKARVTTIHVVPSSGGWPMKACCRRAPRN